MESQANLGKDIALQLLDNRLLRVYQAAESTNRVVESGRGLTLRDFKTVEGHDNLSQALVMRLLTPQGELAPLGHPNYGSRLHEIIGARNTATIRNLAKLHVMSALNAERRVNKITALDVAPHPSLRQVIIISAQVLPIGSEVPLTISFTLELQSGGQG